ncbi:MAG TPA: asparagine synthase-related protein [Terracidiphilus sp.]|nr:asparagine synthase-related protein [Terracidiphilus sp.]
MPGIVGVITKKPREWAEKELGRMVEPMLHESYYRNGTWIDEELGVYIGWVALENSFAEEMPIRNERNDIVLVFSGEDFPDPATLRRVQEQGHERDGARSSYLVHVYEDDPQFFRNLNGRFQGLVADRARGTATLFNDRFGIRRVYIYETSDAFYFSAEAKSILAVRPELRSIDPQGLGEYIACGCVLENRTLFQGLRLLPPGSAWRFRGGAIEEKNSYFEPREWEEQDPLDEASYYHELRDVFTDRLPRYFDGPERIGVSLTGGLDTRIIMAWRKAAPGSLPCYTFGSMYRENQDVHLARRVATICDQPHEIITADGAFLSKFPQYAERTLYLTDGCVDVSRSPDLYCNEVARQIAPVRMVGTFGSEIIRGAIMFKAVTPSSQGIYRNEVFAQVAKARDTYRTQMGGNRTSAVAFRQTAAHQFGIQKLEQSQLTVRTPYLDNEVVRTVFRAPREEHGEDVRLRLIRDGSPELAKLRTDRGLGGSNRFASAINRAYLEFTFKAEYAYDYGMPQWVAKTDHVFAPFHLERLWMGRHKIFHFRWWYRTALANYVKEMLLDSRTLARPYLERAGVEAVVSGHLKGTGNYTTEIHRLLSLELLHRTFVDAN